MSWPVAVPAAVPRIDGTYRTIAAIIAAAIAVPVLGGLYLAAGHPELEAILHLRWATDPGQAGGTPALLVAGPAGSAVAGWMLAPRAIAADRWSGTAMGLLTYVIAITIGSVILVVHMYGSMPPEFRAEGGGDVVGAVPMMSFVAMFVLFPLLPACVACGAVWAAILRRVIRASGGVGVELPSRPFDAAPFALAVLLLGAGWLLFAGLMSGFGGPID